MEKNESLSSSFYHLSGSPTSTSTKSDIDTDQSTSAASISQSSLPSEDILVRGFRKFFKISGAKAEEDITKMDVPGKSESLPLSSYHLSGSPPSTSTKSDIDTDQSTSAASISQSSLPSEDILVRGFRKFFQISGTKGIQVYVTKMDVPGKSESLPPSSYHLSGSPPSTLIKSDNDTGQSTSAALTSQSSSPSKDILGPCQLSLTLLGLYVLRFLNLSLTKT